MNALGPLEPVHHAIAIAAGAIAITRFVVATIRKNGRYRRIKNTQIRQNSDTRVSDGAG